MEDLAQFVASQPPFIIFLITSFVVILSSFALYFMSVLFQLLPGSKFLSSDVEDVMAGLFKPQPPRPRGRISNSYRNNPRNRYLQNDLLILLKGDVAAAKRLLAQQRRKNPGQSDNWYLEKVIYDIERDRH
jgi:hypothetical protein